MWFHIVTVIFIIAKLAGSFPYSWWIVFAPSIASVVFAVVVVLGVLLFAAWAGR